MSNERNVVRFSDFSWLTILILGLAFGMTRCMTEARVCDAMFAIAHTAEDSAAVATSRLGCVVR